MAVPPKDVLAVANACLPQILAKALPDGQWAFGMERYSSPHPNGSAKRKRDYRNDIVIQSKNGQWADRLAGVHGSNILSLLAHLQNRSLGAVGAELARTLNPMDAMRGQPVPPGLRARSKQEDSESYAKMLTDAAAIQRQDGGSHGDALFKLAQSQMPKFRRR